VLVELCLQYETKNVLFELLLFLNQKKYMAMAMMIEPIHKVTKKGRKRLAVSLQKLFLCPRPNTY